MITDGLNPLNVLLFVGLVLGGGAAALLFVFSLVLKRADVARLIAKLTFGGAGAYVALFLIASLSSTDRILGPNQEKHICEVDCHLAYAYITDFTFDVPTDAQDLRLVLASRDIATPFLIGHENGLFHGKTTFRLSASD